MNILIANLKLENFKCFKSKEFSFSEKVTTISGRNGSGKTTIADAILFCLFGKNTQGQSDLELFKTREDGKVIPNLDHSVEMVITHDGIETALKRSIKEVWVKKRGSDESVFKNNTVEYFVDGESFTKGDYEKYISTLINETVFKAITNPTYFPSLKWQDQRAFLTSLVDMPKLSYDDLVAGVLSLIPPDQSLDDFLKHLSYQIKEIKKKLDKIPVRLEEQNKALPEKLDWDAIEKEISNLQSQTSNLDAQILALKQGNGVYIKREELWKELDNVEKYLDQTIDQAKGDAQLFMGAHRDLIAKYTAKFNETLNNQKLMEQTIAADERLIAQCSTIDYEELLQDLRNQWPTQKFSIDPQSAYCPTCGQPIPQEQYQEKVAEMREKFNLSVEAKKKDLNAQAAKIKQMQADAAEEKKRLEEKLNEDKAQLVTLKDSINEIFAEKAKLEKQHVKTYEEILDEDTHFQEQKARAESLKQRLYSLTNSEDDKEKLSELEKQKQEAQEHLSVLNAQRSTKFQYDRIQALIAGINEEQKNLITQLSEMERQEDIARDYQFRQNEILEDKINEKFNIVQWRLFRTVNNGGDSFEEPFCECYVDGIPYHTGLNQAARLNAGLDIINALCTFYNVSAPIVLDNAESTINILETEGQQLRLHVADTDLNLK